MNDASFYAIKFPGQTSIKRGWHPIARGTNDITEAMNVLNGRVLLRTTVEQDAWVSEEQRAAGVGVSMVTLDGVAVGKRWVAEIEHPHFDDEDGYEHPGIIRVVVEYALVGHETLWTHTQHASVVIESKGQALFRWFNADADMPRPTPHQVQAVALQKPAPSEVECLRIELEEANARAEAANRLVEQLRAQLEHDGGAPWIWSSDDTPADVDTLANDAVVRITGAQLRSLIAAKASQE